MCVYFFYTIFVIFFKETNLIICALRRVLKSYPVRGVLILKILWERIGTSVLCFSIAVIYKCNAKYNFTYLLNYLDSNYV